MSKKQRRLNYVDFVNNIVKKTILLQHYICVLMSMKLNRLNEEILTNKFIIRNIIESVYLCVDVYETKVTQL